MELPKRDKEDDLRDYVIEKVKESGAFQQERIKEVKDYVKRYEAKRSISGLMGWGDDPRKNPKDFPWKGSSDVGIPIDAFTAEGLLPRFLKVCFGSNPIVWVKGIGDSDVEKSDDVQLALNYRLSRLINIYRKMKIVYKTVILEGDGFCKVVWEKQTRPFNKIVYNLKDSITNQLITDENGVPVEVKDGDESYLREFENQAEQIRQSIGNPNLEIPPPEKVRNERQEEKTIYEGPVIYGRSIKELIIPKDAVSPEIEEWEWIADSYKVTFDWLARREGDIKEGKFKNIDKIRENIIKGARNFNQAMRKPILINEWYGKYDIDEDGKDEELIVFVAPEHNILLGWMLSPFAVRPFFHYQIIPMEGKPYGKGVPEFLFGMRDMIDAIFNQMIDRGSITNNPPIITPKDHEDERNPFGPGVKWKSDDPMAYRVIELPKSEQMEFSKMEFLLGMVQKLFGVTDYSLGTESSIASNRTATGIMTIVGEGNIKFDDMIRGLQNVNEDLYNFIVSLNSENLSDDFIYYLTEGKDNPFKKIHRSYWEGNFDFEAVGNSININRQIEQERAILSYREVLASYGKNPAISEATMVDVTKNFFRSLDIRNVNIRDINEIMAEKQNAMRQQQQAQNIALSLQANNAGALKSPPQGTNTADNPDILNGIFSGT